MASLLLTQLAASISADAATVSDFLSKDGRKQPSFAADGPATFPATATRDVQAARSRLIHAARQIQFLALGPTESLQWYALTGALDTASLRWIYHYGVPSAVPQDGSIAFGELAEQLHVSQTILTRVVRHAMTNNLFTEPTPGHVAHTSLSLLLAQRDNPIRGVVGNQTEVVFPAVAHMVEAHGRYGTDDDSVMHTPFHEAFGTDMRALDWMASDPIRAETFGLSMKARASSGAFSVSLALQAFDWGGLGEATVVDVGGSSGRIVKAIAGVAPRLRFVVQDLPSVTVQGEAELEPEYKDRITFQPHNFFDPNPVARADVFLLRQVLHDWPEADAIAILRHLVARMDENSRLLINDLVMAQPGSLDPMLEKQMRNADMMMMAMFNGLERTREDWENILRKTDPALRIVKIVKPEGSALSMIEVARQG